MTPHDLRPPARSVDAVRLKGLIETCIMMSMSRDRQALLQQLLGEGRRLLNCDGATMYMVTDQQTLRFELRTRSDPLPSQQIPLYNEHMVHTITMLEQMPFPKHLRRVPEYAGTHHERMDGKGYPRQLGPDRLSVPSRIMAVADIFEALTASDRPYKKPKKLSEALAVLKRMAGPHVDADVFNLFLASGVYLEFARKHLDPAQIDVDDASPFYATGAHA